MLIEALRVTAARLRAGADYQWGHFGACNCGHLAQTITRRSRAEIHQAATVRARDWGDAAVEYCPASGYPIDHILDEMLAVGITLAEIRHLEALSDRRVLARLPEGRRYLERNRRDDVVLYLETWADLLEDEARALPCRAAAALAAE
jgi:hypothetical protein